MHAIGLIKVIQKTFSILLPNIPNADYFVDSEDVFCEKVMCRLTELDQTLKDPDKCRQAIVEVAWRDMAQYCKLLRLTCENLGFRKIAQRYLHIGKLHEILLGWDGKKLARLKAIVDSGDSDFGRLMMRISEVIDGRENVYDNFDEAAKKKVTEDAQNISRRAETLAAMGMCRQITRSCNQKSTLQIVQFERKFRGLTSKRVSTIITNCG